jgi:hypothetical protein
MNNTPDSPAKPPDDRMDQGGNYWTLFTPGIWKVLHAVLQTMGWRNVLVGAALLVAAVLIGAGSGYWLRGEVPVLVGVRAGAEHCEDRSDGSRLCWIPVFERLPPGH